MNTLVVDSSVVLKWVHAEDERHRDVALAILERYRAGSITLAAPFILPLEILNVAARSWLRSELELRELATIVRALRIDIGDVAPEMIAPWAARGLTAYDASYIALAERFRTVVVTDDQRMVSIAPHIATALAMFDIDGFIAS